MSAPGTNTRRRRADDEVWVGTGSGSRLRIAIVGTGVAGLSAAWLLNRRHDVIVYEKADRLGGHSNTVLVPVGEGEIPVDTGFIVFNPRTYPNFVELLKALGVKTQISDMSFAVSLRRGRIEYSGANLFGLFAQPATNLASPTLLGHAQRPRPLLSPRNARRPPHS
jgi:predicted NAD/FAD-binding protein